MVWEECYPLQIFLCIIGQINGVGGMLIPTTHFSMILVKSMIWEECFSLRFIFGLFLLKLWFGRKFTPYDSIFDDIS